MSWKNARWIPSSICCIGAAAMAWHGHDGWGTFLFVAILFAIDW